MKHHPVRFLRPAHMLLAAVLLSKAAITQAQTAIPGDDLDWIGGTSTTSWTASGNNWTDIGNGPTTGNGPVSLAPASGNQGQTFGFFFIGGSNPTYGTAAPTSMVVGTDADLSGQLFGVNYLSFTADFNATDTMTLGSGRTNGLANSLNFVSGWTINDRATSGTVTINTYNNTANTQTFGGLYLTLNGTGSISPNTGSTLVLNVALTDGSTAGGISKSDGGTLVLNGASNGITNSYSGGTTINGGTVIVSGANATGTGAVHATNSGFSISTLAGTGTILGATTIDAGTVLAPGGTSTNPIGILKIGTSAVTSGLTLNGTLRISLQGGGMTAGVNNSELQVAGTVQLGATSSQLVVNTQSAAGLALNQKFFLVLNDGVDPVVGTFQNLVQGATVKDNLGDSFTISYLDNGDGGTLGNDISLTVTGVVPEPSTWALLSLGAVSVGMVTLRRRSACYRG